MGEALVLVKQNENNRFKSESLFSSVFITITTLPLLVLHDFFAVILPPFFSLSISHSITYNF